MRDYVPGWVRPLPWVVWSLALFGLALSYALDVDAVTRAPLGRADDVDPRTALAVALVVLALAEAVSRRVVRRPQRSVDVDLLAVDDGLRATGVAAAVAGGLVAALVAFGQVWSAASFHASGLLAVLSALVTFGSMGLLWGAISCVVRQENWGYRRRHRQARPVAPGMAGQVSTVRRAGRRPGALEVST